MKFLNRISIVFALSILYPVCAFSQPEEKVAVGFSFVNALGSSSPTYVKLNGKSYRPSGYPPGAITDGGMLYAGAYSLEIANSECKSFTQAIRVDESQSPVYVAYSIDTQREDGSVDRKVACLALPNFPKPQSKHAFYGVFAAGEGGVSINVNGSALTLDALKVTLIAANEPCIIEVEGKTRTLSPEDSGNFVVVVYRSAEKLGFSVIKSSRIVEKRAE